MAQGVSPSDLLYPLDAEPRDARSTDDPLAHADALIYRLGLRATPVPNVPAVIEVGGVRVDIVEGPVLVQRTEMQQRPGTLPPTFDKYMVRELVGVGDHIAIFSIYETPVPESPDTAFLFWRQRAEAAAGALAAVLDERVVGVRLFEDAVLFSGDSVIGAMDRQERVRNFLPMEVTALDRPALDQLAGVDLGDGSAVARASRLYRRAASEGPTADAYVLMYVAMESLLEGPQPRKRTSTHCSLTRVSTPIVFLFTPGCSSASAARSFMKASKTTSACAWPTTSWKQSCERSSASPRDSEADGGQRWTSPPTPAPGRNGWIPSTCDRAPCGTTTHYRP